MGSDVGAQARLWIRSRGKAGFQQAFVVFRANLGIEQDAASHFENGLIALLEGEVADGWRHCRAPGQKDL